jgi:hypothetical protein
MVKSKILRMHRMCVDYAKQYDWGKCNLAPFLCHEHTK